MAPPLPDLVMYTRTGCHLCDEARDSIQAVLEERAAHGQRLPTVVVRDIDAEPDLRAAFGDLVPVIELGDRRLQLVVSAGRIRRLLADVLDGSARLA